MFAEWKCKGLLNRGALFMAHTCDLGVVLLRRAGVMRSVLKVYLIWYFYSPVCFYLFFNFCEYSSCFEYAPAVGVGAGFRIANRGLG